MAISLDLPDPPPPFPPTMNAPSAFDLGVVEETRNPLTVEMTRLDRPKFEKDCSTAYLKEKIEGHVEKHGDLIAEMMAWKGLGEVDVVNQDALAKVLSGQGAGGLLETISIGIGFFQNFGVVEEIDIP